MKQNNNKRMNVTPLNSSSLLVLKKIMQQCHLQHFYDYHNFTHHVNTHTHTHTGTQKGSEGCIIQQSLLNCRLSK